ncbi:hypothetical protein EW145_g2311 [Phellinidium pouzarii]|uniref:Uncharacterized protein n=1 Tax=Phellinidium pouzarii TaxID=167371 RepID=A0A4S4LBS2_9AGAM|nr:hypothetical protein EW145_g2311 [Phellinidium pouzarii]
MITPAPTTAIQNIVARCRPREEAQRDKIAATKLHFYVDAAELVVSRWTNTETTFDDDDEKISKDKVSETFKSRKIEQLDAMRTTADLNGQILHVQIPNAFPSRQIRDVTYAIVVYISDDGSLPSFVKEYHEKLDVKRLMKDTDFKLIEAMFGHALSEEDYDHASTEAVSDREGIHECSPSEVRHVLDVHTSQTPNNEDWSGGLKEKDIIWEYSLQTSDTPPFSNGHSHSSSTTKARAINTLRLEQREWFPEDLTRLLSEEVSLIRLMNLYRKRDGKPTDSVLMVVYIESKFIARRYLLFQYERLHEVNYTIATYPLQTDEGRLGFLRTLYNLVMLLASGVDSGRFKDSKNIYEVLNHLEEKAMRLKMFRKRSQREDDANDLKESGYELAPRIIEFDHGTLEKIEPEESMNVFILEIVLMHVSQLSPRIHFIRRKGDPSRKTYIAK